MSKRIGNMFWKDVFISWIKIISANRDTDTYILNDHICRFNPKIKINNMPIFFKHYCNARLVYIRNILDSEGNILSLQDIRKLNIKTNFIEYAGLKKSSVVYSSKPHRNKFHIGPIIPKSLKLFYKNSKGCKDMYNILLYNKTEKITSVKKWRENRYTFSDTNWSKIFELPFKTTQESKFHWLQYQILLVLWLRAQNLGGPQPRVEQSTTYMV
jgi:hypothetical protein